VNTTFNSKDDIIAFGLRRGILIPGLPANDIVPRLQNLSKNYPWFNTTRVTAFTDILDVFHRNHTRQKPAHCGSFEKITSSSPLGREVTEYNPREYFKLLMEEHDEQIAREEEFLEKFVKNNPGLTPEAKALMTVEVTVSFGPWHVRNHVCKVTQMEDTITVYTPNSESYYYLHDTV
jgi:hypothetical protein